jgi:hypothetical protein
MRLHATPRTLTRSLWTRSAFFVCKSLRSIGYQLRPVARTRPVF